MRHWKQRRHMRKIGYRRILVNPNVVKKQVRLKKDKRNIFQFLAKKPTESGGYMDFNKKDLENVEMYFGNENELETPDADYEIEWHTHPSLGLYGSRSTDVLPSDMDVYDFLINGKHQQASLIFHDNDALALTKTSRSKAYVRKPRKDIEKDLNEFREILFKTDMSGNKKPVIDYLKSVFGLNVRIFSINDEMDIPLKVVEETKKNRRLPN